MATSPEQERAAALAWNRRSAASLTRARAKNTGSSTEGFSPLSSVRPNSSKPPSRRLQEKGGAMGGRIIGGLVGSAVPIIGTTMGAFLGGMAGKSAVGRIVFMFVIALLFFGLLFIPISGLMLVCQQYRFLIKAGSHVSEYADGMNQLCGKFEK